MDTIKKLLFVFYFGLFLTTPSFAQERMIYIDREWESSLWAAYQTAQKLHDFNHIIICLGIAEPETINDSTLKYFINMLRWQKKKISLLLNISDGPGKLTIPGYSDKVAERMGKYVSRYSIDGINFDGVRTYEDHPGAGELVKVAIRKAVTVIWRVNPNIEISVDTRMYPWWEAQGALPVDWLAEGLVDHIYLMEYEDQIDILNIKNNVIPRIGNNKFTITVGSFYTVKERDGSLGYYGRDPEHVDVLIKSIEGLGDGYGIYSYQFVR